MADIDPEKLFNLLKERYSGFNVLLGGGRGFYSVCYEWNEPKQRHVQVPIDDIVSPEELQVEVQKQRDKKGASLTREELVRGCYIRWLLKKPNSFLVVDYFNLEAEISQQT